MDILTYQYIHSYIYIKVYISIYTYILYMPENYGKMLNYVGEFVRNQS